MEKWDVTVIGGGLAGLTTAAFLAKEGLRTLVLEQSPRWGGRAATDEKDGCLFNIGPHALYSQGQGLQILQELGLDPGGNTDSENIHGPEPGQIDTNQPLIRKAKGGNGESPYPAFSRMAIEFN
ncbi:MAG: FAD-dependent oxidoreductase [Paenibacillaceae bacterium]|nr:FAD-dependent oxidoreductase [Paenibacillaceae bacterium]